MFGHICLLHTNELPLRHLLQHLDEKTNDSRGFTAAIGKMLENCEKLSVTFEPIEAELPIIDPNELSTDQISSIYVIEFRVVIYHHHCLCGIQRRYHIHCNEECYSSV